MKNPRPEENDNGLKAARLPDVTRLNRNVLLVAGMGVAVVVLAVTHVVRSDARSFAKEAGTARVEAGTVADFLRTAPVGDQADPVPPPVFPDRNENIDTATGASAAGPSAPTPSMQTVSASSYAHYGSLNARDPREEAYERALGAGLRPREEGVNTLGIAGRSREGVPDHVLSETDAGVPGGSVWPAQLGDVSAEVVSNPELTSYVRSHIKEPVSEHQIMAGTVLPAALITAMNSDMPGEVLAQISRNVYDSRQRHMLIPRGTRVIGRYENQVALGQSRVLIAWTRLLFPDGRSLSLPGLPTKDLRGASGVRSQVNNHYGRLYGQAALLSIIGAAVQLSQPQQSSAFAPASAGQVAAGALGQQLSQVSMETIRRNMDVRPTLEVTAGTPFYIFLERDLVLDRPYVDREGAYGRPVTSSVP